MWRALMIATAVSSLHASFADSMRDCTEGDNNSTISGCSQVVESKPAKAYLAVALANRARAYQQTGQVDKSIDDLNAAVETDPTWGYLYRERAAFYAHQGTIDQARKDIDASIALDPNDTSSFYLSCQLWFHTKNYEKAAQDCSKMIALDPHVAKGYIFRGQSYWFEGDFRKAADDLFKAVLMDRSSAQAYAMLGDSYLKLGDQDHALEALNNAIIIDPNLIISRVSRGEINQAKGNKEQAQADYRAALALPANDDLGRKLQRDALEGLTTLQAQNGAISTSSPTGAGVTPRENVDQTKRSMCEFSDPDQRKTLGCDRP